MKWSAWLVDMVGPLAARILVALGINVVFFTGLTVAVESITSNVQSNLSGLPLGMLQLAGLFGIWEALGITLGGFSFILAYRAVSSSFTLAKAS
jgi:hypothetical protein